MPKKDKPFQNVNASLSNIWGTPINAQRQGGHVHKSPIRAGIKIDLPLTPAEVEVQKLVCELLADEKAAAVAADPRSDFEKKYDIRDRVAHITPQQFRDLFFSSLHFTRLKQDTDRIHIEDGYDLSVDFTFQIPDQNDTAFRIISSRNIRECGLTSNIGTKEKMVLRQAGKSIGIFNVLSLPENLSRHSLNTVFDDSKSIMGNNTRNMTSPKEFIYNGGNYEGIFGKTATLKAKLELKENFDNGITLTVDAFRKREDGPLKIGTLWHPDKVDKKIYTQNGHVIATKADHIPKYIKPYSSDLNKEDFIYTIFNSVSGVRGASGIEFIFMGQPIAILLREGRADQNPHP